MMPVAILCGGRGARLGALTNTRPKSLVLVAGIPFLRRQLKLLAKQGYFSVVFCLGHLGYQIYDELVHHRCAKGRTPWFPWQFEFSRDGAHPRGTAGAIRYALPLLGDAFFTLYGDSYLDCDYQTLEERFRDSGKLGLLTEWRGTDYGLSAFKADAFVRYPDVRMLPQLHTHLKADHQLDVVPMPQPYQEIGSVAGLKSLEAHLALEARLRKPAGNRCADTLPQPAR